MHLSPRPFQMQGSQQAQARASLPLAHEACTRHAGEGGHALHEVDLCYGCLLFYGAACAHNMLWRGAPTHLPWTDVAVADRDRAACPAGASMHQALRWWPLTPLAWPPVLQEGTPLCCCLALQQPAQARARCHCR